MKILLIQPYAGRKSPNLVMKLSSKLSAEPNLTLQQLGGIIPKNHTVEAIDENHGDIINYNNDYDLICISCRSASSPRAYEIAQRFKDDKIPVILGGYHPTALPDEAKKYADSVIIGEGEISLPQAIDDIKNDKLKSFYKSEFVDPKLIPPARRDLIDYYLPTAGIEATRGCPINCDFCFVQSLKGPSYRKRPIENVVDELQSIKQKNIIFYDSSLTIDSNYTKSLFKKMIGLNKRFSCYGNINAFAKDEELLKLASEAGCISWCIGFESISQNILDKIGKSTNKVKQYNEAVKKIRDHNISITGSFIFGFDDHDPDTFKETMDMINQLNIDIGSFNILTPFPGTDLFERLTKEKRIISYDWGRYSCWDTVFQPQQMTQDELYGGSVWILKEFYSLLPTIKRIIKSSNLGFHPFLYSFVRNSLLFVRKFDPGRY